MHQIVNQNILDFTSEQKYHSIISDPPYGLAFMNKGWDSFKKPIDYQKWVTEWSGHLMQFLYPGAICMFFGGTRTYHRLASGLEDAGYEIFDSMIWCYGSGFPKSYNISKGIDKSLGLERSKIRYNPRPETSGTMSGHMDTRKWIEESRVNGYHEVDSNEPVSNIAQTWNGYGTAIKPAYEPIVLCRKPLDKGGYVNSVLKYGTSGLNIDGSRIETDEDLSIIRKEGLNIDTQKQGWGFKRINRDNIGRFPANFGLICDCEKEPCECIEKELDNQSGNVKSNYCENSSSSNGAFMGTYNNIRGTRGFNDKGGASRFFYTAKASSKERELGLDFNGNRTNNHPTVKPIKLIEYLAKLLLPPIENSSILIPFSGVGSEMIGSYFAGWQNITGVEIDEHYVEIANKRLDYWTQFEDYESAMKNKANLQTSYQDTLVTK